MNNQVNTDISAVLLRSTLGAVMIAHSLYLKLVVFTLPGTAQFFQSLGLPYWFAFVVFAAEALGGFALILGVKTRLVALGLIPILLGATWVHWGNGWLFTNSGGGWEYPLVLALMAGVLAFHGGGRYAIVRDA